MGGQCQSYLSGLIQKCLCVPLKHLLREVITACDMKHCLFAYEATCFSVSVCKQGIGVNLGQNKSIQNATFEM